MIKAALSLTFELDKGTVVLTATVPCLPTSDLGFHYTRKDAVYLNSPLDAEDPEPGLRELLKDGRVAEDVEKHLTTLVSAAETLKVNRIVTGPLEDLQQIPFLEAEHQAWLEVVEDLKALGLDINDPQCNALASSICLWGEQLVALRLHQPAALRVKAALEHLITFQHAHGREP